MRTGVVETELMVVSSYRCAYVFHVMCENPQARSGFLFYEYIKNFENEIHKDDTQSQVQKGT